MQAIAHRLRFANSPAGSSNCPLLPLKSGLDFSTPSCEPARFSDTLLRIFKEEVVCGASDFYSFHGSLPNPPAHNIFGAFERMIAPALVRDFAVPVVLDSQIHARALRNDR
jgi:hypothetical protein